MMMMRYDTMKLGRKIADCECLTHIVARIDVKTSAQVLRYLFSVSCSRSAQVIGALVGLQRYTHTGYDDNRPR